MNNQITGNSHNSSISDNKLKQSDIAGRSVRVKENDGYFRSRTEVDIEKIVARKVRTPKEPIFKEAVIYYPEDEKIMKQINKEIAALHSVAAIKYMDTLNLNDNQKVTLIDSLTQDLKQKEEK